MKHDRLTALALRMKNGNRKAAEEIHTDLNPKIYGFFFSRTGARKDVAEDLTQDLFMRLVQRIKSFDEEKGKFVVWLWQIARNMLVDHYRMHKEIPFSTYEEGAVERMAMAPVPDFDDCLKQSKIKEILESMREDDQELFGLRYVSDLPYGDIAEILGKPESGLRVAVWRIKKKIQEDKVWAGWRTVTEASAERHLL